MTPAPIESRFRVTVFLPLRNKPEYYKTLNWLINRLNREYLGLTASIHQPLPVFRGFYFSPELRKAIADRVVLLISDAEMKQGYDVEELEAHLRKTKGLLHKRLPNEEEFWIGYHPITRIIKPTKAEAILPAPARTLQRNAGPKSA